MIDNKQQNISKRYEKGKYKELNTLIMGHTNRGYVKMNRQKKTMYYSGVDKNCIFPKLAIIKVKNWPQRPQDVRMKLEYYQHC
jgi:hypothetical protein